MTVELSLDSKCLKWYVREHLEPKSHNSLSIKAAKTAKRTETAQYQFLSMLFNRSGPFNEKQRRRLKSEFGLDIDLIRKLYSEKKGGDQEEEKKRPVFENQIDPDEVQSVIVLLREECDNLKKQNEDLRNENRELLLLLKHKDEQLSKLLNNLLND